MLRQHTMVDGSRKERIIIIIAYIGRAGSAGNYCVTRVVDDENAVTGFVFRDTFSSGRFDNRRRGSRHFSGRPPGLWCLFQTRQMERHLFAGVERHHDRVNRTTSVIHRIITGPTRPMFTYTAETARGRCAVFPRFRDVYYFSNYFFLARQ